MLPYLVEALLSNEDGIAEKVKAEMNTIPESEIAGYFNKYINDMELLPSSSTLWYVFTQLQRLWSSQKREKERS